MVTALERMKKDSQPKPAAPTPIAIPKIPETAPTVDVTSETSIAFTTRVQPILMNTCASCHSTGAGGKFHLDRVTDNTQKAATQRNLAAVMAYIDLNRPGISPLLTRAITPHGSAQVAAIKDRGTKPFQTMQQWIEMTVARNPQLKDYAAAKKDAQKEPLAKRDTEKADPSGFASQKAASSDSSDRGYPLLNVQPARSGFDTSNANGPRMPQGQADRYGADGFNKQFHPHR